jgi:hypothetical protein
MPEFCTCGAELPPDARFCHRCGKPQREEDQPRTVERRPESAPEMVTAAAPSPTGSTVSITPPRVNFHNATAVRTSLLMASVASLLTALPLLGPPGLVIWWLTAGFFSSYVYRRRTGHFLTVDGGLRMGWITGLLGSTITSVFFTASMVVLTSRGGFASVYQEQMLKMSANDPNVRQALKMMETSSGMAVFVIVALFFLFLIITFLCTAGGALGAKLVGGVSGPGPKAAR